MKQNAWEWSYRNTASTTYASFHDLNWQQHSSMSFTERCNQHNRAEIEHNTFLTISVLLLGVLHICVKDRWSQWTLSLLQEPMYIWPQLCKVQYQKGWWLKTMAGTSRDRFIKKNRKLNWCSKSCWSSLILYSMYVPRNNYYLHFSTSPLSGIPNGCGQSVHAKRVEAGHWYLNKYWPTILRVWHIMAYHIII